MDIKEILNVIVFEFDNGTSLNIKDLIDAIEFDLSSDEMIKLATYIINKYPIKDYYE